MAKRDWFTTGEAASKLDFAVDTIRAHMTPLDEYEPGSGKVPFKALGGRRLIPRWWVDDWVSALEGPPEVESADSHGQT